MAIVYTTNVGVGKELSKDCSLPVPTVGYTNSDEGGLPFRMTRKSIPTTLLLLIEFHGLLLFLHRIEGDHARRGSMIPQGLIKQAVACDRDRVVRPPPLHPKD